MLEAQAHAAAAPPERLQIALLGPPTLTWDGQAVPIPRRQARALLYRLAAAPQPLPRDLVSFLLWPDCSQAEARRNLSVVTSQLRRALPASDLLITVNDAVGLYQDVVAVDVARLAAVTHTTPRPAQLDGLAAATALYRGPFLDGFALPDSPEFETWMAQERQHWERRYLDLLTQLIAGYAAAEAYAPAIVAAQRALTVDPLVEELYRWLMVLYAAQGDRSSALRQFEQCVLTMERDLGVEPLPETRAVYDAVRAGDTSLGLLLGTAGHPAHDVAAGPPPRTTRDVAVGPVTFPALPASPTPLVGRQAELAALGALLGDPQVRLLTLTGPGGSGKTRLAMHVAQEYVGQFPDGVVFIPLASLRDPARLLDVVAQACDLHGRGQPSLMDTLRTALAGRRVLVVLDNVEHLLPAAPLLADLLTALPDLRLLVTGRSRLHLSGEHVFPVPPLKLPDLARLPSLETLASIPSVALLLARTRALSPGFQLTEANAADLATLCVRLDGLPLAIELAAARLKLLSPAALLRRLEHRLTMLDNGPRDLPDRQRTLWATIDWSYQLLDRAVQCLFEQLAVFAGGWTLAAAEEVCALDNRPHSVLHALETLLDTSLVVVETGEGGEPRFAMLETIRTYGLERLQERGEMPVVQRRHALTFAAFVARQAPERYGGELERSLRELDSDYPNIRAALGWMIAAGEHAHAAGMAAELAEYWDRRGLTAEGQAWMEQLLPVTSALGQPLRSRLQAEAAFLTYRAGAFHETVNLAELARVEADAAPEALVMACNSAALAAQALGDQSTARASFGEALALAERAGLGNYVAGVQLNLGVLELIEGRFAQAEQWLWTSHARAEQLALPRLQGIALIALGAVAVLRSDGLAASARLSGGLELLRRVQETTFLLYGLLGCAALAILRGEALRAAALYSAGTSQARRQGLTFTLPLLQIVERPLAEARGQGNPGAFDTAEADGGTWSLADAVERALVWLRTAAPADSAAAAPAHA
jgi:predicted ATPase/DNA-binding SARP family transcriptional activator